MHLAEGLTADTVYLRGGRWQPPPLYGLIGSRAGSADRVLLIANETPIELLVAPSTLETPAVEQLHFDKFCSDWLVVHGNRPYEHAAAGLDRSAAPDFTATKGGNERVGVDCVQFAIEGRRLANAQFAAIKRTIAASEPERFSHLGGLLVYVWVQTEAGLALPLRPRQQSGLLDALTAYRYQPGSGETVGIGMPETAPPLDIAETGEGWRFYATPLLIAAPSSPFFYRMGFEMAFVFGSEHTPQSGWADLLRRVVDHDQPAISELVVTIGGPDRNGYIHPSEEAIFDLMLQDVRWSYEPKHLTAIYVHGWETGRIIQLHPERRVINVGHFQGLVPPHQPLVPR
jgi:hypothetical protein